MTNLAKLASELGREVGSLADLAVSSLYHVVGLVEKDLTGEGAINVLSRNAKKAAQALSRKATQVHADVKAAGGYAAKTNKLLDKLSATVINGYFAQLEQRITDDFFTAKGEFDPEKASRTLKKSGDTLLAYGSKGVACLTDMVRSGAAAVKADYRTLIPSQEELRTKYAGIGVEYEGVLFRPSLDACLAFYATAESKIPAKEKTRPQILVDIKAHAAENLTELRTVYREAKATDGNNAIAAQAKLAAINQYLSAKNKPL